MILRLSENAHLLRYPHPSSLRRTSMYASFLGISEALHMDIFHQPLRSRFFDSLLGSLNSPCDKGGVRRDFQIVLIICCGESE
jgi:hypothetical protein